MKRGPKNKQNKTKKKTHVIHSFCQIEKVWIKDKLSRVDWMTSNEESTKNSFFSLLSYEIKLLKIKVSDWLN